jgi:hypothetical protein
MSLCYNVLEVEMDPVKYSTEVKLRRKKMRFMGASV